MQQPHKYPDIGMPMEDIINDLKGATALLVSLVEQTDPEYSLVREWKENGVAQIVARVESLCAEAIDLAYNGPKAKTSAVQS